MHKKSENEMSAESKRELLLSSENVGVSFSIKKGNKEKVKFWAIRGIDIDIFSGDVLGIVGRNGSGKSTFARLLAGIYEPSEGKITRNVEPTLLSLGTGFNTALTGRQNIYLNGAYHQMSRRRIALIEKDIIEFAELEDFIDIPIKHYSSGMRARLGFSIAAFQKPRLLILDEVLSTGDRFFRSKATKKVKDMMDEADAVIVVSHQDNTILELCNTAILLEKGQPLDRGNPEDILQTYQSLAK